MSVLKNTRQETIFNVFLNALKNNGSFEMSTKLPIPINENASYENSLFVKPMQTP